MKTFNDDQHMEERKQRILEEFSKPYVIYKEHKIHNTIVFFGSARSYSSDELAKATHLSQSEKNKLQKMTRYHDDAIDLAYKVSTWSKSITEEEKRLYVCSGGGDGIMLAANQGANKAGLPSIGLNIKLPHEQMPNHYQTPELSFNFSYFFIRKYWFATLAKALIVFPGGFGTMDELFEILTLSQTNKMPHTPVILYGRAFWEQVFNFDLLTDWGLTSKEDELLYTICDDTNEALSLLQQKL